MTTALAMQQQDDFSKSLAEIENTQKMCSLLMKTPHYAKMGEIGIFTVLQKARSVGLNPLDALNGAMYYVNGKVELSANTMNYMIRAQGHSIIKDPKSNAEMCILHGKRVDNGDTWIASFSIKEAKMAGIYKSTWEKYPEDMLFARALTRLARQLFPDVIKGCYVEGEIRDAIEAERYTPVDVKQFEVKVETITDEQAKELDVILEQCDADYITDVRGFLLKQYRIEDLKDLPSSLYDRLLKGAMKRIQENAIKREEFTQEVAV